MVLSDLEYLILDELYFVSSYQEILEKVGCDGELFKVTLKGLLEKGLVTQMNYNTDLKDFIKPGDADSNELSHSHFVATRQGLIVHNSRD
jgi:hypothetical protein